MSKYPKDSEFSDQFEDFSSIPPEGLWEDISKAAHSKSGSFSQVFSTFNPAPPVSAWGEIEQILHPDRKKRIIIWWSSVAAVLLVGLLSYVNFGSFQSNPSIYNANTINGIIDTVYCDGKDGQGVGPKDEGIASFQYNNIHNTVNTTEDNTSELVSNTADEVAVYQKEKKKTWSETKLDFHSEGIQNASKSKFPRLCFIEKVEGLSSNIIVPGENHYPKSFPTLDEEDMPTYVDQSNYLAANFGTSNGSEENGQSFADNTSQDASLLAIQNEAHSETRYKRRPPVQLGFDFQKSLGKKSFLTIGLTHTKMVKESITSDQFNQVIIKENYVGLPISIGYSWLVKKKVILYSSFGHIQEAKLRNKFTNVSNDVTSKSWHFIPQFGVEVSTGLNYRIYKNLGVATSVSVSHYYYAPQGSYWNDKVVWPKMKLSITYNL